MMVVTDTQGACKGHPAMYGMSDSAAGPNYRLKVEADGKLTVGVMCSENCEICAGNFTNAEPKACHTAQTSEDVSYVIQVNDGYEIYFYLLIPKKKKKLQTIQ